MVVAVDKRWTRDSVMVWYVALVAVVNLGLGYGLAVYAGAGRRHTARRARVDELTLPANESTSCESKTTPGFDPREEFSFEAIDEPLSADKVSEVDTLTGVKTRAFIEQRLQDLMLAHADRLPVSIALVEVDHPGISAASFEDRLLRGIAGTIRNLLSESHTAGRFSDQQFLLLLLEDDLEQATMHTEQVRQRVATTQYLADGNEIQTTVTCALAQVSENSSNEALLEFLTETLEEAKRCGGNRTFLYDGSSPAPIVPPELSYPPQSSPI